MRDPGPLVSRSKSRRYSSMRHSADTCGHREILNLPTLGLHVLFYSRPHDKLMGESTRTNCANCGISIPYIYFYLQPSQLQLPPTFPLLKYPWARVINPGLTPRQGGPDDS